MMNVYSHSSIIGYESHLHTQIVRLPLKYSTEKEYSNTGEKFESKCYGFSELLDISAQSGLFFSLVQIGVTKDLRTLRLTPLLVDEATSLGVQLQLIEISLPHALISKDTFTYQFVPSTTEEEPYILIDILDENYLLISLRIELSDFLIGNSKNRLVLDNFSDWVNISVPYSFELRSPPFLVKHLDLQNLIVSMKDGGLLHFKRSSPLSTFDIFNFSDIVPLMSFNILGGFFSNSKRTESLVDGISSNCVVDLAPISGTQFVTLSVSKVLKIWDIETHKQKQDQIKLSDSHSSSDWLTTLPNKYLQVHEFKFEPRLSILLPNQAVSDDNVTRFGYEFVTFAILTDTSDANLQEGSSLALNDEILKKDIHSSSADVQVFKVQDFHIAEKDQELTYTVLWKSHTYSMTICYHQSQSTSNLTMLRSSMSKSNPAVLSEFNAHIEPEAYLNSLFNSGLYDEPIIRTALEVFSRSCDLPIVTSGDYSLRQTVKQAVHDASKNQGVTDGSSWFKFALICAQFRKTSSEALSVLQYQGCVLSAQANGIEILGEPHYYEAFMHSSSQLVNLLKKVSAVFSTQTFRCLLSELNTIEMIDASRATELATRHFSDKISEVQVNEFTEELASIGNVLDELKRLTSATGYYENNASDMNFAGQGSGLLAKLAAVDTFENIRKSHESTLIVIFVLLLLCEVNDQVLEFLNLILNRFKVYSFMTQIFAMCFVSTGSFSELEKDSVCLMENAIFWSVAVQRNPQLQMLLSKKNWNDAFDYYCNDILLSRQDEYILDLVLELINRGEGEIILKKFASRMDKCYPLNVFLLGLVYLINNQIEEFREIFANYFTFENVSRDEKLVARLVNSLDGSPKISGFLKSIFKQNSNETLSKSNYFHSLSQLMKSYGSSIEKDSQYLLKSLEFEKKAIDILQHSNEEKEGLSEKHSKMQLMTLYLRNYFCDAVDIEEFDEAIDSLFYLQTVASKADFRAYMTRLVKAILAHYNTKRLFDSEFFAKNYLLVDSIILELANEDLILSNALKCYELLYSWRLFGASLSKQILGDKRGAVEGLYIFVTRFKGELDSLAMNSDVVEDLKQFKLKILELYKVILNTLKTFDDEKDCWIRRRSPNSESLSVVKINELNVEYYQWLKELEQDFMN